jgi:hypothetical protein
LIVDADERSLFQINKTSRGIATEVAPTKAPAR